MKPGGIKPGQEGVCQHFYKSHVRGGEPVSVRICDFCTGVDWNQLRLDIAAYAYGVTKEAFASVSPVLSNVDGDLFEIVPKGPRREIDGVHICGDDCQERHDHTEREEDTLRRYAGQLVALRQGLIDRNWNMTSLTEDELVDYALKALDKLADDARRLANSPHLGNATTKELLEEIGARGRLLVVEGYYPMEGSEMNVRSQALIEELPGSVLDYRTVDVK